MFHIWMQKVTRMDEQQQQLEQTTKCLYLPIYKLEVKYIYAQNQIIFLKKKTRINKRKK